jgi:uncharacterized protein YuzE
MRTIYSATHDVVYVQFKKAEDGEVCNTVEATTDILLDFDARGLLLGIEILGAKKKMPKEFFEGVEIQ